MKPRSFHGWPGSSHLHNNMTEIGTHLPQTLSLYHRALVTNVSALTENLSDLLKHLGFVYLKSGELAPRKQISTILLVYHPFLEYGFSPYRNSSHIPQDIISLV